MNGLHKDDAIETFHDGQRETKRIVQQQVQGARASKNKLQCHSAHKGRHDEWQHPQGLNEKRASKIKPNCEVGQRNCDQRGKNGRHDSHIQAVQERLAHQVLRKECAEMSECETVVAV